MGEDGATTPGIDELVIRALDALERGAHDELETLCAAHPEHASTLRRRIALLGGLGVLGTPAKPITSDGHERLGEFELVEQLGAGGMGVVYRARQERLQRDVALKIVRPEFLYFPETRERFRREVETVARLQHPGIVPVYTVGEERGVPFFTMEFVPGASLEKLLARVRGREPARLTGADLAPAPERSGWLFAGSWEDACLRIVRQVAEALEHAHERGVIHRDLKPSNVMLSAGAASRVLLLDFGLSSLVGAGKLTRTGAQLGTLDYMSPEQVRGDAAAIGPASDVYALGATLYELLTLAKPFDATSMSAAALAIERGELARPRARNPALSWEAETLVLTAMDRDPARRYPSAAAFARDLENALAKRPLDAKRMSPWLVARRWIERNPMRAFAAGLLAFVVLGGPSLWAWQQQRAARELAAERDVARANLDRALAAVDAMLVEVASKRLQDVPQVQHVRRALLERARNFYDEFVLVARDDPRVASGLADVHQKLASVLHGLGDFEAAAASARQAIELAEAEVLAARDDVAREERARILVAGGRNALSQSLWKVGRPEEAEREARAALETLDGLVARGFGGDEVRLTALDTRTDFAFVLRTLDRRDDAQRELERADEDGRALAEAHPTDPRFVRPFAYVLRERAFLATFAGELPTAREFHAREVALLEPVRAAHPDDADVESALAIAVANLGRVTLDLGDAVAARPQLERAVELLSNFIVAYPLDPTTRTILAGAIVNLGIAEGSGGDVRATLDRFGQAREQLARAANDRPDNFDPLIQLAQLEFNVAMAHARLGELDRTAETLDAAYATIGKVRRAFPANPEYAGIERSIVQRSVQAAVGLQRGPEAVAYAERFVPGDDAALRFEHARQFATCVPLADESTRAAVLDKTFAALELALASGFADAAALATPTWEPLAGDPRLTDCRARLESVRERPADENR